MSKKGLSRREILKITAAGGAASVFGKAYGAACVDQAPIGITAPAPGAPVWLDVALDNSNGGGRGSQFWWIGDAGSWNNPSTWKRTSFVAAP